METEQEAKSEEPRKAWDYKQGPDPEMPKNRGQCRAWSQTIEASQEKIKPSHKLKSASGQWVNSQVSSSVEGRIEMRTSYKQGSAFLRPMLLADIVGEIRTSPGGSGKHEVETLVNEARS